MFFRIEQSQTIVYFVEAKDRDEAEIILEDMWNEDIMHKRLDIREGVEYTKIEEAYMEPNEDMSWIVSYDEDGDTIVIR